MHQRQLLALSVCVGLALSACASPPASDDATGPSSSPEQTAIVTSMPSPTPTQTPPPAEASTLSVTLDGISYLHEGEAEEALLADGEEVVALMQSIIGEPPQAREIDDPWGSIGGGTHYAWSDVMVSVSSDRASVVFLASAVGGVPVVTPTGIAVGSTRAEAVAAGAWDEWDEDGDGTADYLGVDPREVPGTASLSRPGSVGIEFMVLAMDGDLVSQLEVAGNDFADI